MATKRKGAPAVSPAKPKRGTRPARDDRLALITEAMTEGVYEWDIESGTLDLSKRFREIIGLATGRITADDFNSRVHPDDFEHYRGTILKHFRGTTEKVACEYRVKRKGGRYVWIADSGICVRDRHGRAVRLVGAVRDIDARKRAEAKLHAARAEADRARQEFHNTIEWASGGIVLFDAEDRIVVCNDHYRDYFRAAAGPAVGELVQPGASFWDILQAAFEGGMFPRIGSQAEFEEYLEMRREVRRNPKGPVEQKLGDGRWLQVIEHKTAEGGIASIYTDITEMKRRETELEAARGEIERAREQMTDAIESMSEGFALFDEDDRIVIHNSNYRQYFKDAVGEAIARQVVPGASLWDLLRAASRAGMFPDLPTDDVEPYIEGRIRDRRAGKARQGVEQHLSDGRWMQISEHSTADGGIASVYTDITDLKHHAAELAEKTATLEGLSKKLARYLSPQIYDSIFSGEQAVEVAAKRKKLTIFFSDIADFTATADLLESEELTALLNQYLTEMSKIALKHGATIDKFIGDAILAFCGDPESRGERADALACVRMAIAMQRRMRTLREEWADRGLDQTFEMRIGITTGYCTVGNFGSEDRLDYTVIGNKVNLAARIQVRAARGGILLGPETYSLVKDEVAVEERDTLELKGIPRPVRTYAVTGIYDEPKPDGPVIRHAQDGLRLELDRTKLKGRARAAAIKALEEAAKALKD